MRRKSFKNAFTLIEVMVAVMIISVVIMALIQMYANNTHIFFSLKNQVKSNQYSSFLIANDQYGFENKNTTLYDLVSDFDLEDELRRDLKERKIKLSYEELDTIDLSESEVQEENGDNENFNVVLEVGRGVLKLENSSSSILRFKLQ